MVGDSHFPHECYIVVADVFNNICHFLNVFLVPQIVC